LDHHSVSELWGYITLPRQCLPNDVGFHLSLIVQVQVTKVGTTHALVWFAAHISFRPDVWDSVGAWLNYGYNISEGVRFLTSVTTTSTTSPGAEPGTKIT
jgi:hypothetical protein